MRHYYGYDINGTIKTVEIYGPAGWPNNQCLEDPDCINPGVTSLRESRTKTAPEVVDWVLFDCPCDASQGDLVNDCKCFNTKLAESYVDTDSKTLVAKPLVPVLVDGEAVTNDEIITRAPGTTVILTISSSGMPNGAKAHCTQKGSIDLTLDDEWDLVFSAGLTDAKTLTAPAQGSRGCVFVTGPLMPPLVFHVRGFATPE